MVQFNLNQLELFETPVRNLPDSKTDTILRFKGVKTLHELRAALHANYTRKELKLFLYAEPTATEHVVGVAPEVYFDVRVAVPCLTGAHKSTVRYLPLDEIVPPSVVEHVTAEDLTAAEKDTLLLIKAPTHIGKYVTARKRLLKSLGLSQAQVLEVPNPVGLTFNRLEAPLTTYLKNYTNNK